MKDSCIVCREGVDALAHRIVNGGYNKLEDLSLCGACSKKLVESVQSDLTWLPK